MFSCETSLSADFGRNVFPSPRLLFCTRDYRVTRILFIGSCRFLLLFRLTVVSHNEKSGAYFMFKITNCFWFRSGKTADWSCVLLLFMLPSVVWLGRGLFGFPSRRTLILESFLIMSPLCVHCPLNCCSRDVGYFVNKSWWNHVYERSCLLQWKQLRFVIPLSVNNGISITNSSGYKVLSLARPSWEITNRRKIREVGKKNPWMRSCH